jgi:hypothetical protein
MPKPSFASVTTVMKRTARQRDERAGEERQDEERQAVGARLRDPEALDLFRDLARRVGVDDVRFIIHGGGRFDSVEDDRRRQGKRRSGS